VPQTIYPSPRRRSLDVFRGITVLGMIVVNAADLDGQAHPWLRHSLWNGCTAADLVFPGFLFIMGAALGLALTSYTREQWTWLQMYGRVLRRSAILFSLGLALNVAVMEDLSTLRIMGVLQRIALCYLLGAAILLHLPRLAQWGVIALLLLGYWAVLSWIPIPLGTEDIGAHLPGYLDRMFLGRAHLLQSSPYDSEMDPEGLLTTAPALANTLFGAFMGRWLSDAPRSSRVSLRLAALGALSLAVGVLWSFWLPLNKALWTSSYALVTTGAAVLGFAACHELDDVRGVQAVFRPFEVIGLNAVIAYLVSTALNAALTRHTGSLLPDASNLYEWLVQRAPEWTQDGTSALLCASGQALAIWGLTEWLYRRGWSLRI
jgi:predicted acyltransferase